MNETLRLANLTAFYFGAHLATDPTSPLIPPRLKRLNDQKQKCGHAHVPLDVNVEG